jgi:hypothetical protein
MLPVIEYIQPGVNADSEPLEYGPIPAGEYMLMHLHGGVNVVTSQPKYAGGFYRFVYSTEGNTEGPQIVRLHHPEIGRYNTGREVVEAYSGKKYVFNHTGGYIQFSFDDIAGHYTDNVVTAGQYTGAYVQHGLNYGSADVVQSNTEPIAPIFALINIGELKKQNTVCNPPLYTPSFGLIPAAGTNVVIYSTTAGATIYYTMTTGVDGVEPAEPPVPTFDSAGNPTGTTTLYSNPIQISDSTKFKAVAKKTGLLDSPLTSIYYFGKKKVLDINVTDDLKDIDDDPTDDATASVIISPSDRPLPLVTPVTMSCNTSGVKIYYTYTTGTTSTEPTEPATPSAGVGGTVEYTGPITVTVPTKFKAYAVKTGLNPSGIASAYYWEHNDFLSPVEFTPASGTYTEEQFGETFSSTLTIAP